MTNGAVRGEPSPNAPQQFGFATPDRVSPQVEENV